MEPFNWLDSISHLDDVAFRGERKLQEESVGSPGGGSVVQSAQLRGSRALRVEACFLTQPCFNADLNCEKSLLHFSPNEKSEPAFDVDDALVPAAPASETEDST